MDPDFDSKNQKYKIFSGTILLIGIFALAVGAGMFYFGSFKGNDVRVISASDYDQYEIGKPQVEGIAVGSLIDVNSATQKELEDLPGIGPVTAGKIIAGRPYQSVEELLIKKAVGRALFEKIGAQLTASE